MVDPEITAFLNDRKEAWLKKNISASISDTEKLEKHQECEQVFALNHWLPNAAKRAGQMSISTHPCTFSHPSARKNKNGYVSSIIAKSSSSNDGFLRTGNIQVEADALGNAAALDVYKFLTLTMQNGMTLLEHIEQESDLAKDLLTISGEDYQTLRSGFLSMVATNTEMISSSKIKQVYFPIFDDDNDEYHLLSILTNSGILYELRQRIDHLRFSDEAKEARANRRNNEYHPQGYRDILDITTIGYGGTKPQNISVLNNQNAGKAHLLASIPPSLTPRNIKLPKTNFFKESIYPAQFRDVLRDLHQLFKASENNKGIREKRDELIQTYIDQVIERMWQVRAFWENHPVSDAQSLPYEQKIWLLPEFKEERQSTDDWLNSIIESLARTLLTHYASHIKKPIQLGDDELLHVIDILTQNQESLR